MSNFSCSGVGKKKVVPAGLAPFSSRCQADVPSEGQSQPTAGYLFFLSLTFSFSFLELSSFRCPRTNQIVIARPAQLIGCRRAGRRTGPIDRGPGPRTRAVAHDKTSLRERSGRSFAVHAPLSMAEKMRTAPPPQHKNLLPPSPPFGRPLLAFAEFGGDFDPSPMKVYREASDACASLRYNQRDDGPM